MTRTVHCCKLKSELPGLEYAPLPGALGERVYQEVSAQAWQEWTAHQTMLINEYRLSMLDKEARAFLGQEMVKFLFGEGATKPQGYVPPSEDDKK